ncbi:precorrin-8X methylmutase [Pleurocapsa sp. PCC 7319]|uniref:precorrin-8X methylmutase n=1 Tax=Pleurocapsa sp. PCC 7319 TaxID=118161 RepID=UPI0003458ECC|nr:precorrin-8X methylmutase [Pleurocapsa sp. PCC 7319]
MDLHITEASSLAIIDRQLEDSNRKVSPAQYEIIRRVIYQTADFEYGSLLRFSEDALIKGAAALSARTSIVVDVSAIQVSIVPRLQQTFLNPVYCCTTIRGQSDKTKTIAASGLETLGHNYPDSIFIIGQDQTALATFIELNESSMIKPSLIIATSPLFGEQSAKLDLRHSSIPSIYIDSSKGNSTVATAIMNSLINLAWIAYNIKSG